MADGKFIQIIDGKEYNLLDYYGRIQYAPDKYYSYTAISAKDSTGMPIEGFTTLVSGWPVALTFTIANSQAFGNDPWIKSIQTTYGMKLNGMTTPTPNLSIIDPDSFVNFKNKACAIELPTMRSPGLLDSGSIGVESFKLTNTLIDTYSNATISSTGLNMSKANLIVIQAHGGNGGTASGVGKSGSGGGSGGLWAFIVDPRTKFKYVSSRDATVSEDGDVPEYYLISQGTDNYAGSSYSKYSGIHVFMGNSKWDSLIWLGSIHKGYDGAGASIGGAGGYVFCNPSLEGIAFYTIADLDGVSGGRGGDDNHRPGEDIGSTTIYATNSTSYKTEEYNHIGVGGFTGGADDTATIFNAQTGGGGASYFANGGAGAIGSNNAGGNGSKGSGGGGGCASSGTGGTGGCAYIEIYHY